MTKFFPKVFITGVVLFLLLGAGYGITQAARAIPWDCADWQAFAHEDRTTVILESLAENRGKTLYCGVDQSDTFTKAETWEAGKDRNERDDTIYSGERGIFRGFIAAQEGWLTDGESGVTGISIDRIFEFPREERRRTKRVKRFDIGSGPAAGNTCMTELRGGRMAGTLICSGWGTAGTLGSNDATAQTSARWRFTGRSEWDSTTIDWRTFRAETWMTRAENAAKSACRARGGQSVSNVAFGGGHNNNRGQVYHVGDNLGWFFWDTEGNQNFLYRARHSRTWSATCKKTIRRTRK